MTKSNSVYYQACKLIRNTPNKLTFDQIFDQLGVDLNPTNVAHVQLALNWAQQAHKAYIRRR